MPPRNRSRWDEYERGGGGSSPERMSSVSSATGTRSVQFEQSESSPLLGRSLQDDDDDDDDDDNDNDNNDHQHNHKHHTACPPRLLHRRSSTTNRLAALTEIGGVNSIRSFTRSWKRAAGFAEVIPQRPNFLFAPDQDPGFGREEEGEEARLSEGRSSMWLGLDEEGSSCGGRRPQPPRRGSSEYRERERHALESELGEEGGMRAGSYGQGVSIFATPPHLATPPIVGSWGSFRDYGSVRSERGSFAGRGSPAGRSSAMWRDIQQQDDEMQDAEPQNLPDLAEAGLSVFPPTGEVEPILVKEVEQDGKTFLTVSGQSTLPQTIFNSINVLIGVGLLSLPMGIKYAGWLCGLLALFASAAVTAYTARILARCMDLDPSLITFSDLAFHSFGRNARVATSVLFTLELLAACVALMVLFADSLHLLMPGVMSLTAWKMLCAAVLVPLHFLPLRLLSFTSVIGILSCFSIVLILLIDGFIKPTAPGSLIEPATTYWFPANWLTLPLSFGLLMSPWGGHSVFPNIYRDMRHPYKYPRAIKITFSFTYLLDAATAVGGLLMFGDDVRDAITSNILKTAGYPRALSVLMCTFVAIIPLTKIPLNARPIISTAEVLLGVHQPQHVALADGSSRVAFTRSALHVLVRMMVVLTFLAISILFPAFDSIMAFMGSALCFTICVTLPLAFYLKLFGSEISSRERMIATVIMVVSILLSIAGTVWAFLPKSLIGAA